MYRQHLNSNAFKSTNFIFWSLSWHLSNAGKVYSYAASQEEWPLRILKCLIQRFLEFAIYHLTSQLFNVSTRPGIPFYLIKRLCNEMRIKGQTSLLVSFKK